MFASARPLAGGVLEREQALPSAVQWADSRPPTRVGSEPGDRHPVQVHHFTMIENAQVDASRSAGRANQALERDLAQAGPLQGDATELEELQADPYPPLLRFSQPTEHNWFASRWTVDLGRPIHWLTP